MENTAKQSNARNIALLARKEPQFSVHPLDDSSALIRRSPEYAEYVHLLNPA